MSPQGALLQSPSLWQPAPPCAPCAMVASLPNGVPLPAQWCTCLELHDFCTKPLHNIMNVPSTSAHITLLNPPSPCPADRRTHLMLHGARQLHRCCIPKHLQHRQVVYQRIKLLHCKQNREGGAVQCNTISSRTGTSAGRALTGCGGAKPHGIKSVKHTSENKHVAGKHVR